jgi:pimeloyl-ACP methyl ester carboxylesterase
VTTTPTPIEPATYTLEVPGAVLTYDIRAGDDADRPPLFLLGSPMGAAGFGTLAGYLTGRTVITYDPRAVERSRRTDGATETTPEEHADDLHRIIGTLDRGPLDMLASSGGAVNALVLVARHRGDVQTLVAHEPPAARYLPDAEVALGELTRGYLEQPAPDPAMFGLPVEDDGSRDDPLLGQNMVSSTHVELDFEALQAASTRVVIGVGADSGGELAARAGRAVAERLGQEPVVFPSGHAGFLGGEYGQTGEPEAFADTLRTVLG